MREGIYRLIFDLDIADMPLATLKIELRTTSLVFYNSTNIPRLARAVTVLYPHLPDLHIVPENMNLDAGITAIMIGMNAQNMAAARRVNITLSDQSPVRNITAPLLAVAADCLPARVPPFVTFTSDDAIRLAKRTRKSLRTALQPVEDKIALAVGLDASVALLLLRDIHTVKVESAFSVRPLDNSS